MVERATTRRTARSAWTLDRLPARGGRCPEGGCSERAAAGLEWCIQHLEESPDTARHDVDTHHALMAGLAL